MNSLRQFFVQVSQAFWALISRIEESQFFERWVLHYESLDGAQQKRFWSILNFVVYACLLSLVLIPLLTVVSARNHLADLQTLTLEMIQKSQTVQVERRPAPPPSGWQNLPASNTDEMELSLAQFLAAQGVSPNLYAITLKVNNFKLAASEVTLRQALNLTFQLDGWFPAVVIQNYSLKISKARKDLVDLELAFVFDPSQMNRFSSPGFGSRGQSLGNSEGSGDGLFAPESGQGSNRAEFPNGPRGNGGDFPPAPSGDGNFDSSPGGGPGFFGGDSSGNYLDDSANPPPLPMEPVEEDF